MPLLRGSSESRGIDSVVGSGPKVTVDLFEQVFEIVATMIPGDVVVDVPPEALDGIGLGTVRGQEVTLNLAIQLVEDSVGLVGRVRRIVVHHDVDGLPAAIPVGDHSQKHFPSITVIRAGHRPD